MALFTDHGGRQREPLGGADQGFDIWLQAMGAERHYGTLLRHWEDVKRGKSPHVRDDLAQDHFEVTLIAEVMSTYGAVRHAMESGYRPGDTIVGGRQVADISAEYLRACLILACYVGVGDATVAACRDDQDALMSLGKTRG
ncbi:hypothetical protein [Streptomyces cucumeris]|uniref:hypothetical protein n=1 Tax=Streptomyces cucumeris TaxID=2962890 RepID=UPI0020C89498|nr:hypothetical protein [Streptomyces sp. NEAU-Y11]MCP9209551.1 hypothetical protein [Streptomyces sp. NEAU-Y11]